MTRTADMDNLGINFDLVPLPATAAGNVARQLYQTLVRTEAAIVHILPVTATDGMVTTIPVDAPVPDTAPQAASSRFGSFPTLKRLVQVQGKMIFVPHVHSDNSVTLALALTSGGSAAKAASGRTILLRTMLSGDMLVLSKSLSSSKTFRFWAAASAIGTKSTMFKNC